jgi:3-hydroxymyristoyl/3-hydroxydecanoyl-(acyl carrier protein) dehydratase
MGSALPFDGPMHFRNLGGRATVLAEVLPGRTVETTARLIKSSRMGEMLIQHYRFACRSDGRPVYEGVTHFGFFSPQALAGQAGLIGEDPAAWPARPARREPYPEGPHWPKGRWRMLDRAAADPRGGPRGAGTAFAQAAVNPEAWFFRAPFFPDPVWPGTLGLEAFIQAMELLVQARFGPLEEDLIWAAPAVGQTHEWLYRGQITPDQGEMTLTLAAREADDDRRRLTADGLVFIDGRPIYKLTGFTAGPAPAREPAAVPAAAPASGGSISADRLLKWRKDRGSARASWPSSWA